jgi:hypothetical protein
LVVMGTVHPLGGFRYLPRQDGSPNGRIAGYKFYVSADGVNWGTPVAQGTFANNSIEKTVSFSAPPSNQPPVESNAGNQHALALDPIASPPQTTGTPVRYTAVPHGGVNPRFSWSFGDGTAATALATTPGATHTFAQPGRYTVTVTATDDVGANVVREFVQAVHHPLTAAPPTVSMSIAYEGTRDRVWNVNPDNDTATVFDALTEVKIAEIAVGQRPRSVTVAPDGQIWVANQQSASIAGSPAGPPARRLSSPWSRWDCCSGSPRPASRPSAWRSDRIHVSCRSMRTVPGCSFRVLSPRLCRERRPPPRTRAVAVARSSWSIARRS